MPESSGGHKRFSFNAENREAQKVAREYSAAQITLIGGETKLAIRQIINRSIREGIPPRDAARLIRDVVGLNRPQAIQLINYSKKLDPNMTPAVRRKAIERLSQKLIRRRAMMIARTEVIDALNTGNEVAWTQAQKDGLLEKTAKKKWYTNPIGACEVCLRLSGKTVGLDKSFETFRGRPLYRPTAHPNCRCSMTVVT